MGTLLPAEKSMKATPLTSEDGWEVIGQASNLCIICGNPAAKLRNNKTGKVTSGAICTSARCNDQMYLMVFGTTEN
jgi:hypothetical protein